MTMFVLLMGQSDLEGDRAAGLINTEYSVVRTSPSYRCLFSLECPMGRSVSC